MTSRFLLTDIKHEEGLRLHAYPDPVSGGDPWTVGYGSTGPDIGAGDVWTEPQADVRLRRDVAADMAGLDHKLPWWRKLDDNRQDVLVQMVYQLGLSGLLQFTLTLAAAQRGDYQRAADCMEASAWAKQTPARAARMSAQMRSGLRAWAYMDAKPSA